MSKEMVIEVNNISKTYSNVKALDNLSFSADEGDIIGLIGPNGAGKSTAIKIILRLIGKSQGEIKIRGLSIGQSSGRTSKDIGFASESPSFYDYLSGYENLKLTQNLYNSSDASRIDELLEFVGLKDAAARKVKTYSTGMKQRLGLARALFNKPRIVILDEPTNGLDPQGMRDINNLIYQLAKKEKITFIISSHLLHDIEKICNKIIVINKGKTIYSGDIESVQKSYSNIYSITEVDEEKASNYFSNAAENIKIVTKDFDTITVQILNGDLSALRDDMLRNNIAFKEIVQIKPALEDIFFMMTGGK